MKFKSNPKGFTLIELLVVISIIGLIAGMVLVSLGGVQAKGRDARRKSDIAQIRKALELYYSDNERYPASGGAVSPNNGWSNSNDASWQTLMAALAPYLPNLPKDPINSNGSWAGAANNYDYNFYSLGYGCDRQWYMVVYRLEKPDIASPGIVACNGTTFNYAGTITIGMRQK